VLGAEPFGQRVPQQRHVTDLPHAGQVRPAVGIPREAPVADEPGRTGVPDEHRRHHQVELVDQVGGEELGEHGPSALDHQPVDPSRTEVLGDPGHVRGAVAAGVHDRRDGARPFEFG
jgi:hypothetical protein